MADETLPTRPCERMFALEDLHVRAEGGDGREVEAYAAVWKTKDGKPVRSEIRDQDGHYFETLTPTSFNRTISNRGPSGFGVLFNHGRTIDGTPNPGATLPIGVPLEVKADEHGVFTRTRYLLNPLADYVLDAIRQGAIKGQSFRGRYLKSTRSRPDGYSRSALPTITRQEVDMVEYGPAVFPAYTEAAILGTRAEVFMRSLLAMPVDKRVDWLQQFEGFTTPEPLDPEIPHGTPVEGPADLPAEDSRSHSAQPTSLRARIQAWRATHEA